MAQAITAQGFKLEIGNVDSPLTYTEIKEVKSFQGFDGEASEVDVTHLRSHAKEFLMGLQDFGSFSVDVNHLPSDPGQLLARAAKASAVVQDFKATFSDGSTAVFQGYVKSNPRSGGVDAAVDGSFAIRITGEVVETP